MNPFVTNCPQVSAHVHRDDGFHDHALTFLFVAWGQFTDHDITLTAEIDEVLEEDLNCCTGSVVVELWIHYAVTTIFL